MSCFAESRALQRQRLRLWGQRPSWERRFAGLPGALRRLGRGLLRRALFVDSAELLGGFGGVEVGSPRRARCSPAEGGAQTARSKMFGAQGRSAGRTSSSVCVSHPKSIAERSSRLRGSPLRREFRDATSLLAEFHRRERDVGGASRRLFSTRRFSLLRVDSGAQGP